MSKSLVAHYRNKYPGGSVQASENAIDVFNAAGELCVALRKDGANQMVDASKEMGALHAHCLSPIPKDARVYKICKQTGHFIRDEEHEKRLPVAVGLAKKFGYVPSCEELEKGGNGKYDEKQRLIEASSAS